MNATTVKSRASALRRQDGGRDARAGLAVARAVRP